MNFELRRRIALVLGTLLIAGCAAPGSPSSSASLLGGKGTPWTIRCTEIQGPERTRLIQQYAEALRNTPGIRGKDVFVRDESDGFARLYYGTHWRRLDAKTRRHETPAGLRGDLDVVRQLGDAKGQRYFAQAMIVRLPSDDVGKPEWNLALQRGIYTLQVAVFEPTADFWEFKQAAADYCDYLRAKGYEAYYHHSDASSVVTVGVFGRDAVIPQPQGLPRYSDAVQRLQRDELLQFNRLNGSIYYITDGKGSRAAVPSRLVEIPSRRSDAP